MRNRSGGRAAGDRRGQPGDRSSRSRPRRAAPRRRAALAYASTSVRYAPAPPGRRRPAGVRPAAPLSSAPPHEAAADASATSRAASARSGRTGADSARTQQTLSRAERQGFGVLDVANVSAAAGEVAEGPGAQAARRRSVASSRRCACSSQHAPSHLRWPRRSGSASRRRRPRVTDAPREARRVAGSQRGGARPARAVVPARRLSDPRARRAPGRSHGSARRPRLRRRQVPRPRRGCARRGPRPAAPASARAGPTQT